MRHGDWKLVVGNGGSGEPELYNLADDLGESKNLAADNSAKVNELQALWDRWNAEQAPASHPADPARKKQATKKKKAPAAN